MACTVTVPVPRFLGRRNSGERVIRSRRVPAVSSSVTRGTASGPAWSLRSPRLERDAGHVGVQGEADGVEQAGLARAGGPVDEEEPLGRRARRRRRRPGRRTARTPRSRAGAPSRGARRPGARPPSSSPTWRATRLASTASASRARSSSLAARPPRTWPEEVAADLDVGGGGDPRGVRPQRHRGALRVEAQHEGVREAAAHPVHGAERPLRVGEGDLAPGGLGAPVCGVGEQLLEGAAQHGQRPLDRRLDVLDDRGARRRGRPAGCPCGASTRRTTSPRGSRCSARPVRPPGGRAGGPARCSRRRRRPSGGTADTPPTLMSRSDSLVDPAGDEGVGHDHGAPAALRGVGAHPRHRRAQHAGVGALGGAQGVGGQGRLEVGQRVDRDVAEQHRAADVGDRGAQVQARPLEQARREPEPDGGVVVAAADDHLGAGVDEPQHGLRRAARRSRARASRGRRRRR